jgi:formylglycine-generating enzyme required for sulfatase activity
VGACGQSGTVTPYWWGASITPDRANYNAGAACGPGGISDAGLARTMPVDSFEPNPWGLYQVHGNVWEWVEDCWSSSYDGASSDGSARDAAGCEQRVLRGGSWLNGPRGLRSARRHAAHRQFRRSDVGFRVAKVPAHRDERPIG